MSNPELLLAYGHLVQKELGEKNLDSVLDDLVQSRRLLTAAEVVKIKKRQIHLGISSAAALASYDAPEFIENAGPGRQVWHYPYDEHHYGYLYVEDGVVVGDHIAVKRDGYGGRLTYVREGEIFRGDGDLIRCRSFFASMSETVTCPGILVLPH